ncbi:MAG: 6-phosphogluconolactonase [Phycisphaerae bacterium]
MARNKPNVVVEANPQSLAKRTVQLFIEESQKAISEHDNFYVAISGGHTPQYFYELLGNDEKAMQLPWNKIHLFWVDERYVPANSKWSNYKLAADTFLNKVPIPQQNIHKIPTEFSDFKEAASSYEATIRSVFRIGEKGVPQFDLIVLGMGADGHTGSLFPNSYAQFDTEDLACVVYVLGTELARITLTHPVLCAAKHIAVLVSGKEKAQILKTVLTSEPDEVRYPIHFLWPILDRITWLVDSDAAKLI